MFTTPNQEYQTYLRKDKVIFRILVGSVTNLTSHSSQLLITDLSWCLVISCQYLCQAFMWSHKAYQGTNKASQQGHSNNLWLCAFIKTRADELATLAKPMDHEVLIKKILDGLDDDYKSIIDVVNGHDATIQFDELHEKLINKTLSL